MIFGKFLGYSILITNESACFMLSYSSSTLMKHNVNSLVCLNIYLFVCRICLCWHYIFLYNLYIFNCFYKCSGLLT